MYARHRMYSMHSPAQEGSEHSRLKYSLTGGHRSPNVSSAFESRNPRLMRFQNRSTLTTLHSYIRLASPILIKGDHFARYFTHRLRPRSVHHRWRHQRLWHCAGRGGPGHVSCTGGNERPCFRDLFCLHQAVPWRPALPRIFRNQPRAPRARRTRNSAQGHAPYLLAHALCTALPPRHEV